MNPIKTNHQHVNSQPPSSPPDAGMAAKLQTPSELIFLLSLLLFSLSITNSQTPDPSEKLVLLKIKNDFGNPSVLQSWNDSTSHCNWTGIQCDVGGSVTGITLWNLNLTEPVPAAVCDLKNLTKLDLSYNDLPGPFPTTLYGCRNLQYLDISQNWFVGPIPSDIDRISSRLTYLSLSANNFTGDIPPSIGRLSALQTLLLNDNLFNGSFPAELGNLLNLETLWLARNPFAPARIPPEFGNMKNLTYLWITSTNLVGEIPESFGRLTQLVHLDLAMNSLSGRIPSGIWMLERMQKLYLYSNKLSGEINATIGAKSLVQIDVSSNNLTGPIPESIGRLENLRILFLYYNRFTGGIPASIGLLPALIDIRIFNNQLTGVLPPDLGKHSKLYNFEVDDNRLFGELPEFLCAGKSLISLVVSNNNFSGNLPVSLGDCRTLNFIEISKNSLSGEFPAGIWTNLVNLTTVIMNHNNLSGELPDQLPWNLTRLDIGFNRLSGKIPSSANKLTVFRASSNSFSGEIPANLAGLSDLQELNLGENLISGEIPASISSLRFLNDLNLSSNRLSGEIPAAMGSMPVLTTLDLSNNQLSSVIPAAIGNLKLNFLNVSSNDLSGEIPISLQNQAYDRSFLSNPGLCSPNSIANLHACRNQSEGSSKLSTGLLVLLSVLGALFFFAAASLAFFTLREYRRRKHSGDLPVWKLTPFHSVEFTESNVLRGLTNENLIGSGGGGMVFKIALGNRLEDTVAVKKIWNSRKLDSKLEKEFQAEVQILGSIRHANIVKLLCCISSSDSKLLVYEYMENESLDRWLHSGRCLGGPPVARVGSGRSVRLDWPARLGIAIGAARGLCYMHHDCSPPIVHRDIKSSNILLDSEFKAKIADFGLARILVKTGEQESVSAIAGSFGYMAPECGWLRKVNDKVDVYSFGVVLLELITGREANDGGDYGSLADWAWRHFQEGSRIADLIDEDIREPSYMEDLEVVFKLGLICTGTTPLSRPSMKEVLQVLQRCDRTLATGGVKSSGPGEYDSAPLLRGKCGSRHKTLSDVERNNEDSESSSDFA